MGGLPDTRSIFPYTEPPICRRMGVDTRSPFQSQVGCWHHEDPHLTLNPTRIPAPGGTWPGCAERGCLYPGGNTDPREGPAALVLYGGAGLGYWLGGAAPREGGWMAAETLTSLPGHHAHPEPRHALHPAPWPCMGLPRPPPPS